MTLNTIIDCLLIYDSSLSKAIEVIHLHLLPGYVGDPQVHVPKLLVLLFYTFVESPGNLIKNKSNQFKRNYSQILGVYSCIPVLIMLTAIQVKNKSGDNASIYNKAHLNDFGANLKGASA